MFSPSRNCFTLLSHARAQFQSWLHRDTRKSRATSDLTARVAGDFHDQQLRGLDSMQKLNARAALIRVPVCSHPRRVLSIVNCSVFSIRKALALASYSRSTLNISRISRAWKLRHAMRCTINLLIGRTCAKIFCCYRVKETLVTTSYKHEV